MTVNNMERGFPVLHLADGPASDDPAEARKRMLKQLVDRLDERHIFARASSSSGSPVSRTSPTRLRRACDRDRRASDAKSFDRTSSSGSPYFHEPPSIVFGLYRDGRLLQFCVDGRRFEPTDR